MGKKKEQSTGFFGNPRIGVPVGRSEDKQFGNTLKREFYSTREVHSVTSSSKGITQTTKMFKDQLLGTQTYINKSNGAIQLKSETILPSAGLSASDNGNVMQITQFKNGQPSSKKVFSQNGKLISAQQFEMPVAEKVNQMQANVAIESDEPPAPLKKLAEWLGMGQ
jgi:hypothetical protein